MAAREFAVQPGEDEGRGLRALPFFCPLMADAIADVVADAGRPPGKPREDPKRRGF